MNIGQQIAIKGAELLGLEVDNMHENMVVVLVTWPDESMPRKFDPVNDGTDMNKLIEALSIDVYKIRENWYATRPLPRRINPIFTDKSRDEAIRECVIKALGLHNDSEALGVDND